MFPSFEDPSASFLSTSKLSNATDDLLAPAAAAPPDAAKAPVAADVDIFLGDAAPLDADRFKLRDLFGAVSFSCSTS